MTGALRGDAKLAAGIISRSARLSVRPSCVCQLRRRLAAAGIAKTCLRPAALDAKACSGPASSRSQWRTHHGGDVSYGTSAFLGEIYHRIALSSAALLHYIN